MLFNAQVHLLQLSLVLEDLASNLSGSSAQDSVANYQVAATSAAQVVSHTLYNILSILQIFLSDFWQQGYW